MAKQRMTNKRLAEFVGVHPNAISYLKNQDNMPRIGGEMLNALCTHLNCTPFDLLEYVPDRPLSDPQQPLTDLQQPLTDLQQPLTDLQQPPQSPKSEEL